jgi:hypothetical protein
MLLQQQNRSALETTNCRMQVLHYLKNVRNTQFSPSIEDAVDIITACAKLRLLVCRVTVEPKTVSPRYYYTYTSLLVLGYHNLHFACSCNVGAAGYCSHTTRKIDLDSGWKLLTRMLSHGYRLEPVWINSQNYQKLVAIELFNAANPTPG